MSVTLIGVFWILIMLICISKGKKAFLGLTLVSLLFQCDNFIVVGELGIGIHFVTLLFAIIVFLPINKNGMLVIKKNNKSINIIILSFFILAITIIISWYQNNIRFDIIQFSILMVYLLFFFELMMWTGSLSKEEIDKIIMFSLYIVTIIGILQLLEKSGITLLNGFLKTFIYNDINNPTICFNNKPIISLYSTFMEPSYCGAYLVACFGYLSLKKIESKKDIVWLFIVALEIILTRSSTAFAGLAITLVLVALNGRNKSVFRYAFPIAALLILIIVTLQYQYTIELLDEVIFEKTESASFKVRNYWNERALADFNKSPTLGVGYKQSRASSFVLTMLAETGIIGFTSVLIAFLVFAKNVFLNEEKHIKQTSIFVLSIFICQSIAIPDLIFSPLWFGIYLFILANNDINRNNLKGIQ